MTAGGREGGGGRWGERPWDGAERGAGGRQRGRRRREADADEGWRRRVAVWTKGEPLAALGGCKRGCNTRVVAHTPVGGGCPREARSRVCVPAAPALGRWQRGDARRAPEAATPLAHTRGGGVEQPRPTDRVRARSQRARRIGRGRQGLGAPPRRSSEIPPSAAPPLQGCRRPPPPAALCVSSVPSPAHPACPTSQTTNARRGGGWPFTIVHNFLTNCNDRLPTGPTSFHECINLPYRHNSMYLQKYSTANNATGSLQLGEYAQLVTNGKHVFSERRRRPHAARWPSAIHRARPASSAGRSASTSLLVEQEPVHARDQLVSAAVHWCNW